MSTMAVADAYLQARWRKDQWMEDGYIRSQSLSPGIALACDPERDGYPA